MESFRQSHFYHFSEMLFNRTGISVPYRKKEMLKMKLHKAMSKLEISSYDEYMKHLSSHQQGSDYQDFLNLMTTNTTEFFREKDHFDFISKKLSYILENNPRILKNSEIRVWSAACSSGQEPVTLAIVLKECLDQEINIKILATDISSKVLSKASSAVYSSNDCSGLSKHHLIKYFDKTEEGYAVKDEIRSCIKYRLFNLMEEFNFKKGFDIIFCRNVMIYFDKDVQEKLISKFHQQLVNRGLLFIGHSESLINKEHSFSHLGPSIYIK